MLSSLLAGVVPGLFLPVKSTSTNTNTNAFADQTLYEDSIRPGVVLRREQVKLVLFEGKSEVADVEDSQGHKRVYLPPYSSCFPTHHPFILQKMKR